MIPIRPSSNAIACQYADKVIRFIKEHTRGGKQKLKKIETALNKVKTGLTMQDLLCMNFEGIKALRAKIDSDTSLCDKASFEKFPYYYKQYFKEQGMNFIKDIGVYVCPYCNRNYIYNAATQRTAQIDHFFPKDRYPIFALSFYNLVPSCATCNHIKSDSVLDLFSPYDRTLRYDTFQFDAYPVSYIDFKIELKATDAKDGKAADALNNTLELAKLYEHHSYIATDLYKKALMYTDAHLNILLQEFMKMPFHYSHAEFTRFILNYYGEDSDFLKIALSKATKDIAQQFGILARIGTK